MLAVVAVAAEIVDAVVNVAVVVVVVHAVVDAVDVDYCFVALLLSMVL